MEYKTIKEIVTSKLREEILSGELVSGKEITINTLAERFNCSFTPIREALSTLDGEGLVQINRHKSVTVWKLDPNEIEEVFQIRALLEGYACNLAVSNLDERVLRKLQANLRKQKICGERKDYNKWFELNYEFHNEIYKYARQSILLELIIMLRNRTFHYVKTYTKLLNRSEIALLEHEEILNAILRKDRTGASKATKNHLNNLAKNLIPYLKGKRKLNQT